MITREYNIVINTKSTKAMNTYASFVQNDVDVNYFNIVFLNGDVPLDLTQFSQIQIAFERSDGVIIAGNTIELTDAVNGKSRYELGTDEVVLTGKVNCIINFFGANGERLSTSIFYFSVVREIDTDNAIQSSNQYSLLSNLIAQVENIKANKWYVGNTEPTADIGLSDDLYFNTSNGNIYQKSDTTGWVLTDTLGVGSSGTALPTGGITGQVLTKQSDVNGDAVWEDIVFPKELPGGGLPGQVLTKTDTGLTWQTPATQTDIKEIPVGGLVGQILVKNSEIDGDLAWADLPTPQNELPTGGTEGQVLTKTVDGVAWQTPITPEAPITDHNSLNGLQGGTAGEYYHLSANEQSRVGLIKKITYLSAEDPSYVGEEGEIIIILA